MFDGENAAAGTVEQNRLTLANPSEFLLNLVKNSLVLEPGKGY